MDRATAAVLASKVAGAASRRLGRGGGTALPGLVAERLEPRIVARLARTLGRGSALVTGTNGKTTTARMLAGMLQAAGVPVLHNRSGSNLMRGLAATVTGAARLDGHIPNAPATAGVFEVDEATVPQAARAIRPRVIEIGNLFRDQLDRYGEVDSIVSLWRRAVAALPAESTLILNADDPSVSALRHEATCRVLTFGVEDPGAAGGVDEHPADARWCARCGSEFTYTLRFFWHVGHWSCPGCGDKRPPPDVAAVRIEPAGDATRLQMLTPSGPLIVTLPLAGLYNVYNALAATATALSLDAPAEATVRGLESFTAAFGRQERLRLRGRDVRLFLCKNPAGVNQVLRTIDPPPPSLQGRESTARLDSPAPAGAGAGGLGGLYLLVVLNDGIADGRDVSWIWDVDFERLAGRTAMVVAAGTRAADVALRLKYAGLGGRLVLEDDVRGAVSRALAQTPEGGTLYVLPTYTAMLVVRDHLAELAGKGKFWEQ